MYFNFVSHSPGDRYWGCLVFTNGQNWLNGCPRDVGKSLTLVDVKGEVWVQCVRTCMLTLERESNTYQSQTYGGCLRSGKSCSSGDSDAAEVWEPPDEQRYPLVPLCFWESAAKGAGSWLRRRSSPARWLGSRHHAFEQVGEEVRRKDILSDAGNLLLGVGFACPFISSPWSEESVMECQAGGLGVTLTWVQIPLRFPGSLVFWKLNLSFYLCTVGECTYCTYLL